VVLLTAVLGSSASASTFSITPGGSAVTVTIGTAGTSATASFSGTAGQRVALYISGSTISSMKISLVRASNSAQVFTVSATRTAKFVDTNTLPANGTYKLTVDPARTYTGHVTLTLYNVPPDASGAVTPGGLSATVTTTVPGQNASFTFPGLAGHRVALELSGVTVSAGSVTVRSPDSSLLAGPKAFATAGAFIDPLTLTQDGTYTVFIDPKSRAKGKVTLTAYDVPADKNGTLTLGSPASNTIDTPGQVANFTFSGALNQRVSLNVESSDFTGTIWLKKPDATVLTSITVTPVGGFLDATTLPVSGTYTVMVDPSGAGFGAFSFVVYDVPVDTTQAITAGGSAVTVTNTAPGQNGYLTFNGTAGQKISVLVSNVNGIDPAELDVLKPNGTSLLSAPITVTSSGAWLQPTVALPVTGQYKILLDPQLTGVGTADVNLYVVPADLSGTITPGTPLSIATTAPGQNAKYTFSASIGQRLSLNLTGVTIQSVKVTIQKPDGTTLGTATKTVDTSGGFIETTGALTVGGTYKVFVDPQSSYFGGITLGLYVVPADQTGTMASGVAKTLITTVPGQNAKWTFTTASANQRVSFNFTSVTMPSVRVTVRSASNALIFSRTFDTNGDFVEPFTIATAGTYTVTVDPQQASTGSVTVTYYLVPADATGSTTVSITTPGQNGKITTTSTSGTHTFTISTNVPVQTGQTQSVAVSVYEGSVTDFAHFVGNSTSGPDGNSFQLSLPSNGTYTILIDPFGPATGSVTVTVS
jgi:hypothetical protein